MNQFILDPEYQVLIANIKQHYRQAQLKAAYVVNHEMIQFYWQLGHLILAASSSCLGKQIFRPAV